jgi:hypothetical protein
MSVSLSEGIWFAIVQFDLSKVTGTVRSATLTLTCESMRSEGVVEVYEANPPGFRIGAGSEKPRQGLALSYPMDRNIESHPKVLFASDFSDLSRARWQVGPRVTAASRLSIPAPIRLICGA